MLQLHGSCEDGEDDQYRYTASIKRVQQRRAAAVQPDLPSPAQPTPGPVKLRYVYVVKVEHRGFVGAGDPQGFHNEEDDLQGVIIHSIYVDLDSANGRARVIYESVVKVYGVDGEIMIDNFRDKMAAIVVSNSRKKKTYSLSVTKRNLR